MAPITTAVLLEISPQGGDHRRTDQKDEKTK
jgi:hypothetical protein